jgi:hypothetical protein
VVEECISLFFVIGGRIEGGIWVGRGERGGGEVMGFLLHCFFFGFFFYFILFLSGILLVMNGIIYW